ncbi:hypothetical protein Tco_1508843 [Tanacetum coccineum]
MLSECNNVKLAIWNDKSEVVCAMCKQCLITANHDVRVLNYVNGMNSLVKKINANVSNTANKRNISQRWSPTGRIFDLKGKIITSSESECQSDCSNGYLNLFMVLRLGLVHRHYDRESNASHQFRLKFLGIVRFGNDHVAAILGYGDLQWGNILITRVYFVEGLGSGTPVLYDVQVLDQI